MPTTPPTRSSLSSLVASRRRRRGDGERLPAPIAAEGGLVARLARTEPGVLEGHVFDPGDPDRRFVVELLLNGRPTDIARAELFDPALDGLGGDGCHGFCFHLDPAMLPALRSASMRIANTSEPVGDPVDLTVADGLPASTAPQGGVEWNGGLTLSGWVRRDRADFPAVVEAWSNGARVAFGRANRWRSVVRGKGRAAEPGFEIVLPPDLADGCVKEIDVLCEGKALPGSPVRLVAFADGLESHLSALAHTAAEAERGRLFDAAFPSSVPFASLPAWEARFAAPRDANRLGGTLAVVVVGTDGAEATLDASTLDAAGDWVGTILSSENAPHRFDPDDLLAFLAEEKAAETLLFVTAGATLRSPFPARLAAALAADPAASVAYCDALLEGADGSLAPLALPAFDYERALEQAIGAGCFSMRRDAAAAAAGRGVSDLHRLFLAPVEAAGVRAGTHLHVPGFGVVLPPSGSDADAAARSVREHLAARGRTATVAPRQAGTLPAVRVSRRPPARSLAIVLDAGADPDLIRPALESLATRHGSKDARIVVAAATIDEALRQDLQLSGLTLSEAGGASAARRLAAAMEAAGAQPARVLDKAVDLARLQAADAELVCVLDARLCPAAPDWLDELLGRFAEDDVGVAAPLILGSCGLVTEAGLVLGPAGRPLAAFADRQHGDPGYGDALLVARQVAAVGPGCFLTRRADFRALGGFDPILFPDHHGSVDYCLKLQALGRRVVVTPDAMLTYAAETDGARPELPGVTAARMREERVLLSRWPAVFANDPFYNPILNRGAPAFAGLAWPPGDVSARRSTILPARAIPPGW